MWLCYLVIIRNLLLDLSHAEEFVHKEVDSVGDGESIILSAELTFYATCDWRELNLSH